MCSVSMKFECFNLNNFQIFVFHKDLQPKTYFFLKCDSDFDFQRISFLCRLNKKKKNVIPGNHTPYHDMVCSLNLTLNSHSRSNLTFTATLTITLPVAVTFMRTDAHAHAHGHAHTQSTTQSISQSDTT